MNSSENTLWDLAPTTIPVTGQENPFPVRRIYCVGRNYVDHIREMKEGDERDEPFFFQKPTDSIVQNGGSIPYPRHTSDFQFEGELVIAIGKSGSDISADEAKNHIFGYATGLDMTRRDRQREANRAGRPWEVGKSFDHSAPCGKITQANACGDINQGAMVLTVNGEERQRTTFNLMIWKIPEIVENLSRQYNLEPGDLIYTGTPAGVGAVSSGDTIKVEISGLDTLEVAVA